MAVSARYGWELPDGPDAPNVPYWLAQLSSDIEATLGPATALRGKVLCPAPPSVPGGAGAVVTFPVGRFTVPPVILTTIETAGGQPGFSFIGVVTAASFAAQWWQLAGAPAAVTADWVAGEAVASTMVAARSTPTGTPVAVTCPTAGCGNKDATITVHMEDMGMPVVCGVCGTTIKAAS